MGLPSECRRVTRPCPKGTGPLIEADLKVGSFVLNTSFSQLRVDWSTVKVGSYVSLVHIK